MRGGSPIGNATGKVLEKCFQVQKPMLFIPWEQKGSVIFFSVDFTLISNV